MRHYYAVIAAIMRKRRKKDVKANGAMVDNKEQFDTQNEKILGFLLEYGSVVRRKHLERIFPYSNRNINYLMKRKRLYMLEDDLLGDAANLKPNKEMLAALTVLCDLYDKIAGFHRADYPAQINFTTLDGSFYEVVYVVAGNELDVVSSLSMQAKTNPIGVETPRYVVIIEHSDQRQKLQFDSWARFVLANEDGSLEYLK